MDLTRGADRIRLRQDGRQLLHESHRRARHPAQYARGNGRQSDVMAAAVSMCAQPLGQMVYGWAYDQMPVAIVLFIATALFAVLTVLMVPLAKQFEA